MIDFDKADFVEGFWFLSGPGWDWLACAWHEPEPESWVVRWRLREYVDGKAFDSKDRKTWSGFRIAVKGTDADIRSKIRWALGMTSQVRAPLADINEYVPVGGPPEEAVKALQAQPWAFMRKEEPCER